MSKLRDQFSVNDRLREYIERMLSIVIENNPQLLEITMNVSDPINSRQSLMALSNNTSNRSSPSESLKANESVNSDSVSTSSTAKQSANQYCRL